MGNPLKTANWIGKQMVHPCHINETGLKEVVVIIETAFAAGIPALAAARAFSCMDITKLRAGISWQCGRALKTIVDQWHDPHTLNAGRFAYAISGAGALELGLWYYFIAELVATSAANWTSLMYSNEGCKQPFSGTLAATSGIFDYEAGTTNGRILFDNGGAHNCVTVGGQNIFVAAGCQASISFSNSVERCGNGQPQCSLQTQIIDTGTGETVDSSNFADGSPSNNGTVLMRKNLSGGLLGKGYQIKVTTNGPDGTCARSNKGKLTVTSFGRAVDPIPVGCETRTVSLKPKNER